MSYAVRNDKQGWRAVSGPDDVGLDEWFSIDTPSTPVAAPPTAEDLATAVGEKRDLLLSIAANRMGPLQDAIDEDAATTDEVTRLKLWKQYRIALNRIELQADYPANIKWPLSPDSA